MPTIGAIVVAAGRGRRMGGDRPKQFRYLRGEPLVAYCLRTLIQVREIRAIVLVVPRREMRWARRMFRRAPYISKLVDVVPGGRRRQDSVAAGLKALPLHMTDVLVHDGARPFASPTLFRSLIQALKRRQAVIPACPIPDTVKRLTARHRFVENTVSRKDLVAVQTPQAFRVSLLRRALDRAARRGFTATDEAALVEWMGGRVAVLPGEMSNIKITHPADWKTAQEWLRRGP